MSDSCDLCGSHVPTTPTNSGQMCLPCFMQQPDDDTPTQTEGEYMTINRQGATITVLLCYNCEGTGWVADTYTCPDCTGRGHTIAEDEDTL
jgi:hypothetical protein